MSQQSLSNLPVLAVIPARYASQRFPGKPLAQIQGKPMIQHVWERLSGIETISRVVVATDDARIKDAVEAFGGEAWMTSPNHPSGTDRVWEVASQLPDYELIINVQGDEPFVAPQDIEGLIQTMQAQSDCPLHTLVTPIFRPDRPLDEAIAHWLEPNHVKVLVDETGRATCFSRAPLPYLRDGVETLTLEPACALPVFHHIGIYGFRREALQRFVSLPPHAWERAERLEQLRALADGWRVSIHQVADAPAGIDTPSDLAKLASFASNM